MPLGAFLDRMIGPGNYLCTSYMTPAGMRQRFFRRDAVDDAATFILDQANAGHDTWFALAAFKSQKRKQENAEGIKALWMDADILRPGDGKDATKAFADEAELRKWVASFCGATGVPIPNVWVKSGYGVHLYWVFDAALSRDEWQPYADAFKALLQAHGAKGDLSVVADAARILRPIETFNFKVPTSPMPCRLMGKDQPNFAAITDILPQQRPATTGSAASAFQGKQSSLAANAKAGLSTQPRDFALIDQHCAQVARSLDEGGASDGRQLWRAMLTLTRFCVDGRHWAHEIGKDHPDYDPAKTDAEVDRIEAEYQAKGFGATLCKTLDAERPGICPHCPYYQNIAKGGSPYNLGVAPTVNIDLNDLPAGFRRGSNCIEVLRDKTWHKLLAGDVRNPELERVGQQERINFEYVKPNKKVTTIHVTRRELVERAAIGTLADQGLAVTADNIVYVVRLIMGWIDLLMTACQDRAALPAFGWLHDDPDSNGFGVGGTFFNATGTEHASRGAVQDEALLRHYTPVGTMEAWRDIAMFVIGQVPELHVALALSFGAPLMELAGVTAGCVAFIGESGVGKTSVFRAGAGVWGDPIHTLKQLNDTNASKTFTLGQTRALPSYWDEVAVDDYKTLRDLLMTLTQGRDKGRLMSTIATREAGSWKTIYAIAANRSVTELIASQQTYRAAILARVLEIPMTHKLPGDPRADSRLAPLFRNYGQAGRIYAKYIAEHQDDIKAVLDKVGDMVTTLLGNYETMERFHLGVAKAIITGAMYARVLNLVPNFDVRSIIMTLIAAIRGARTEREEVASANAINLTDVFNNYLNAHANGLLITEEFKRPGPNAITGARAIYPTVTIPRAVPCTQLATVDKKLRFDKDVFKEWAHKAGQSPREIFQLMAQQWGAIGAIGTQNPRTRLGAGERWSTPGKVKYVELNLAHPALRYIVDDLPTTGSVGSNVVPLRPPKQTP